MASTKSLVPPVDPGLKMRLSSLPVEILTLIVKEVKANDQENKHVRRSEKVYAYEERAGSGIWVDLVALSEVDSTFWALCKPFLWKSISLQERNNADLLYLLKVILPRHGLSIQSVQGFSVGTQLARPDVPRYICDALGISNRFGHPPLPTDNPLDLDVLGEPVAIKFPEDKYGDDDRRRHWIRVTAQRTQLLRLIMDRTLTPNVSQLSWSIEFADTLSDRDLSSLIRTLGQSRLLNFSMHATESAIPRDIDTVDQSYSALAQFISFHPSLEELTIEFETWGSDENGIRDAIESDFLKSIYSLPQLRRLKLTEFPISRSQIMNLSIAPLTSVDLDPLELPWQDCLTFLNQFHTTLKTIKLHFFNVLQPLIHDTVPPSDVKQFPQLTDLYLGGDLPASVVTHFATSPLRFLGMALFRDGPSHTEWMEIIKVHGETLKEIYVAQREMEAEELKEFRKVTSLRGISVDWDWYRDD